jgi:hypothetical protein
MPGRDAYQQHNNIWYYLLLVIECSIHDTMFTRERGQANPWTLSSLLYLHFYLRYFWDANFLFFNWGRYINAYVTPFMYSKNTKIFNLLYFYLLYLLIYINFWIAYTPLCMTNTSVQLGHNTVCLFRLLERELHFFSGGFKISPLVIFWKNNTFYNT